jgi:hypothetical protein
MKLAQLNRADQTARGKEQAMPHRPSDDPISVGYFDAVEEADRAVHALLAAGFSKQQLAVICPKKFETHFAAEANLAQRPGSNAGVEIAEGAGLGLAIGGIALAAGALVTGGAGLIPAIPVLLGGGALAGGFTSYILSDGYGKGVGEFYEEAVHLGKIVVGVDLKDVTEPARIAEAEQILSAGSLQHAGGQQQ